MTDLTGGRRVIINSATDEGMVSASSPDRVAICKKLVEEGYLTRQHGLVYHLTSTGKRARANMRRAM